MSKSALMILLAFLAAGILFLDMPRLLSSSLPTLESPSNLTRVGKHGPDPVPKVIRDRMVRDLVTIVQDSRHRPSERVDAIMKLGKLSTPESISFLLDHTGHMIDGHVIMIKAELIPSVFPYDNALSSHTGMELVSVILDDRINQKRTERELREYWGLLQLKLGDEGARRRIEDELKGARQDSFRSHNLKFLKSVRKQ